MIRICWNDGQEVVGVEYLGFIMAIDPDTGINRAHEFRNVPCRYCENNEREILDYFDGVPSLSVSCASCQKHEVECAWCGDLTYCDDIEASERGEGFYCDACDEDGQAGFI